MKKGSKVKYEKKKKKGKTNTNRQTDRETIMLGVVRLTLSTVGAENISELLS